MLGTTRRVTVVCQALPDGRSFVAPGRATPEPGNAPDPRLSRFWGADEPPVVSAGFELPETTVDFLPKPGGFRVAQFSVLPKADAGRVEDSDVRTRRHDSGRPRGRAGGITGQGCAVHRASTWAAPNRHGRSCSRTRRSDVHAARPRNRSSPQRRGLGCAERCSSRLGQPVPRPLCGDADNGRRARRALNRVARDDNERDPGHSRGYANPGRCPGCRRGRRKRRHAHARRSPVRGAAKRI